MNISIDYEFVDEKQKTLLLYLKKQLRAPNQKELKPKSLIYMIMFSLDVKDEWHAKNCKIFLTKLVFTKILFHQSLKRMVMKQILEKHRFTSCNQMSCFFFISICSSILNF